MSLGLAPVMGRERPRPIAAWRHTAALGGVFVGLGMLGALFQHASTSPVNGHETHPGPVSTYVALLLAEWGLLLTVTRASRRWSGTSFRDLIGGRWGKPRDVANDVVLALGLWVVWKLLDAAMSHVLGSNHAAAADDLMPNGAVASILWIALSLSAGVCEEVAFRGYFQRQLAALTGNRVLAVTGQAALFGLAHGYQGAAACVKIAIYGALFGTLALWRRNLRPGMMAHAWTDIAAGFFVLWS